MAKQTMQFSDELANELLQAINTKFKKQQVKAAYYLDDPDLLSDISGWVSTGCDPLDLIISNRPNGGVPVGRITEITGLEASGKSLLAAHLIADTQRQGGLGVYIDTEAATSREYFQAIGIDTAKMLYIPLETIEEIFETIETIIGKVRSSSKDRLVTIVVDSVMGASTEPEMEGGYEKDGYATAKAILISKGMRKLTTLIARQKICLVFTNQLRERLGMTMGEKYTTSGGKALAFHSSVRLRLKSVGQIKMKRDGVEEVFGIKTQVTVQKNRLGPPLRSLVYDIYFDSGIDNYGAWLTTLKDRGIITTGGAWYTYKLDAPMEIVNPRSGEISTLDQIKFQAKEFAGYLVGNPGLKQELYDKLCEHVIMQYKSHDDLSDDLIVDSDFVGEED